jgi:hypothetical protein
MPLTVRGISRRPKDSLNPVSGRHAGFEIIDRAPEKEPSNARFRRRFYEMRHILQGKVSDHAATCRKHPSMIFRLL